MCAKERLPNELLKIESGLAALSPTSTLSREDVIFAAGKASACSAPSIPASTVSPVWRLVAAAFAGLSLVLSISLLQKDRATTPIAAEVQNKTPQGENRTNEPVVVARHSQPSPKPNPRSNFYPDRESPLTVTQLMAAVESFQSAGDFALRNRSATGQWANDPWTGNRQPQVAQHRPITASETPTRRKLLREFLPSTTTN